MTPSSRLRQIVGAAEARSSTSQTTLLTKVVPRLNVLLGRSRGVVVAILLACLLLLHVRSGQAAPTQIDQGGLAAGASQLSPCDDDVDVDYQVFWLWIYSVEVSDIASSCIGYNIEMTLSGADGSSMGTASSQISGDSANLGTNSWYLESSLAKTVILITP